MKKVLALVMALALACGFAAALGEETVEMNRLSTTGNTTVTMTVNAARDSYIVVIPSKVEIDPVTQYGYGTITLKSGWNLISVNGLDVKLTGAENGIRSSTKYDFYGPDITESYAQNFSMKSEEGNTVSYAIKPSGWTYVMDSKYAGSYGYYTNNLISVNKGGDNTKDISNKLTFYVKTMPPAGVYTDTLTFSIVTR